MKIVLSHAYFLSEDSVEKEIMKPYPPLGLLSISSYLATKNIAHDIIDNTFSNFDRFTNQLQNIKPDILGLYVNFLTRLNVLKIINFLKGNANLKNVRIILGGPDIRYHANEYLRVGADFLIPSEGEYTLFHLIGSIRKGDDLKQIEGLIFLDENKELFFTQEREHIKDLDSLPFPNRKKIDLDAYLDLWEKRHGYRSITINTQRGCPYSCNWCSHSVFGDTYRRRSPENLIAEIQYLQKEYRFDSIWFVDDVFTMSEKWLTKFADLLANNKIDIQYECISRADRLNEKIIQLLKVSGCRLLWIGAESGSQKVLDLMDRRVLAENVVDMIQRAQKSNIETGTFIMLGYPGETISDINQTVQYLKNADPDQFTINLAYPIKGTRLFKQVEKSIDSFSWNQTIDRDLIFKRTYTPKFYSWAIRYVYNEVNAHKNRKERYWLAFAKNKSKSMISYIIMLIYRNL